jgi:hypothetical protein
MILGQRDLLGVPPDWRLHKRHELDEKSQPRSGPIEHLVQQPLLPEAQAKELHKEMHLAFVEITQLAHRNGQMITFEWPHPNIEEQSSSKFWHISDEDITIIDTTTPVTPTPFVANQGPMTRACARKLNYKVNSFLAVEVNSSLNEVLKHGDNFIMLRCLGVEPSWSEECRNVIKSVGLEGIS